MKLKNFFSYFVKNIKKLLQEHGAPPSEPLTEETFEKQMLDLITRPKNTKIVDLHGILTRDVH
jgi:hypothetical protein